MTYTATPSWSTIYVSIDHYPTVAEAAQPSNMDPDMEEAMKEYAAMDLVASEILSDKQQVNEKIMYSHKEMKNNIITYYG